MPIFAQVSSFGKKFGSFWIGTFVAIKLNFLVKNFKFLIKRFLTKSKSIKYEKIFALMITLFFEFFVFVDK